ncbi:MAG: prolyl oligopeptidase family serine peptidase [Bacteroidales bacterium]|nr:prolyl oligopeptidase family serine peptidase [Bacteroidales bacterium]
MKRKMFTFCLATAFLLRHALLFSQSPLTIEKIMQGERFTGFSPENIQWAPSGNALYFRWNMDVDSARSLWSVTTDNLKPRKVSLEERKGLPSFSVTYNRNRTMMVWARDGDLFLTDIKTGSVTQITSTSSDESNPLFSHSEDKVVFTSGNNIFSWDIASGIFAQLTDLRPGQEKPEEKPYRNEHDRWLYEDQLGLFNVLAERKEARDNAQKETKALRAVRPKVIYTGSGQVRSVRMSPDNQYITWQSYQPSDSRRTIIPDYVTESGYTEDPQARSKVGMSPYTLSMLRIYDILRDTLYSIRTDDIPGITDQPDYLSDYPDSKTKEKDKEKRGVVAGDPVWSDDGRNAVVDIFSFDNKDRWIMLLDMETGSLKLLDRQRDEAWIGGPGIRSGQVGWLPDNKTIWLQSEKSGFSHLYLLDITTGEKSALTTGSFEIYSPTLSIDRKSWYFISNEPDPGIRELYRMPLKGGPRTRITHFGGAVEYYLSPDEKYFALRASHANKPWELYLMANRDRPVPVKVTESLTQEFITYPWRIPEMVSFRASDGELVPARLYRPANPVADGPAVIFVHGAGYLQNVHRWWSSYSREYMFHNFLVDNGYTVLDIDYRGSAGYGCDWRTAIYRHMGGRDLEDHIDGAGYLVAEHQIHPEKIGIYGGSYGGFITLMAMFRNPGVFSAGAALRPVTDWAHYNHGYTSNILNIPVADSLAYAKSSPIYYADGLEGALLICHGMIDDNVHFQDVVRLSQRLIELGKENWELAVYPLERHGFTEPSSWADEYRRIFRLFETHLNLQKK